MHSTCMATKTISVTLEAWERLKAARRRPAESFSRVIMRARWREEAVTGAELADWARQRGGVLPGADLDAVEEVITADRPPQDKWGGE